MKETVETQKRSFLDEPRRKPANSGRLVIGILLILGGVAWLLDRSGILTFTFSTFLAVGLVVVGLALVFYTDRRNRGGLIFLGIVMTVLLVASPNTVRWGRGGVRIGEGLGNRVIAPASIESLEDSYTFEAGSLILDLRRIEFSSGVTHIEAEVGVGRLIVIVPEDLEFMIEGKVDTGGIEVFGNQIGSGFNVEEEFRTPRFDDADSSAIFDLAVRVGSIEVTHER